MFLAFFLSNTRLQPLSNLMLLGRWPALLALFTLAWVITERAPRKPWPPFTILLIGAFACIAVTLPSSSNPSISLLKWGVFFCFLLFCGIVFSRINSPQDVATLIIPLSWVFIVFIWLFPPSVFFFYQPLRSSLGYFNGFLRFTNAAGQFLSIGGLPLLVYRLNLAKTQRQRLFITATLLLGSVEVLVSGSRAAAFAMVLTMGLALLRWKTPGSGRANRARLACLVLLLLVAVGQTDRVRTFFYKYPDASNLFESRKSYWDATNRSFHSRQWMGTGFGVQAQQAESSLSFSTTGAFREQGSFFLGIREETGYLGALPILAALLLLTARNGLVLLRSRDPAKLMAARTVVASMLFAVSENYVLYLGNAASILFFFALFLNERLLYLEHRQHAWIKQQQSLAVHWQRSQPSEQPLGSGAV
jgi:cell division protein FtsW (lipid II flippase)